MSFAHRAHLNEVRPVLVSNPNQFVASNVDTFMPASTPTDLVDFACHQNTVAVLPIFVVFVEDARSTRHTLENCPARPTGQVRHTQVALLWTGTVRVLAHKVIKAERSPLSS